MPGRRDERRLAADPLVPGAARDRGRAIAVLALDAQALAAHLELRLGQGDSFERGFKLRIGAAAGGGDGAMHEAGEY